MGSQKEITIIYDQGFSSIDKAVVAGFKKSENLYQKLRWNNEILFFIYEYRNRYYFTSAMKTGIQTHDFPIVDNYIKGLTKFVGIAHSHPPFQFNRNYEISFSTPDVNTYEKQVKNNKNFSLYLRTVHGDILKLDSNSFFTGILVTNPMRVAARNNTFITIKQKRHYGESICPNRKKCLPIYKAMNIKAKPWKNPNVI